MSPIVEDTATEFLSSKTWKTVILAEVAPVNHDSYMFRFALSDPDRVLGLPCGQHIFVRARNRETGEMVQRAYTPVSRAGEKGSVELLVKCVLLWLCACPSGTHATSSFRLYLPTIDVRVGGKMSAVLHRLRLGDTVEIKGPFGSFEWNGGGCATWKGIRRRVSKIGMVYGGSGACYFRMFMSAALTGHALGITPILQVLRGIFYDNPDRDTKVWMLAAVSTRTMLLLCDTTHELNELYRTRQRLTSCARRS